MPVNYPDRDSIVLDSEKTEEEQARERMGLVDMNTIDPARDYRNRDAFVDDKHYREATQRATFERLAREEVAEQSLPKMLRNQIGGGQNQMIEGPAARVTDALGITEGRADTLNRLQNARQGAATERYDEIPYVNERITKGAVGTLTQLPMVMATGAIGKAPAVIGLFTANVANESYTRARDSGLNEEDSRNYSMKMAAIEGGVTSAFNMIGLGSVEKMAAGWMAGSAVKEQLGRGIRQKLANFAAKDLAPELVEEWTIEAWQNMVTASSGVDPNAADFDRQVDSMIDVSIQAAMMTTAAKGISSAAGRMTTPRKTSEIEYLSKEDLDAIEQERLSTAERMRQGGPTQPPGGPTQPPGGPTQPPGGPTQPPGGPDQTVPPDAPIDPTQPPGSRYDGMSFEDFQQEYGDYADAAERYGDDAEGARQYIETMTEMEAAAPEWVARIKGGSQSGDTIPGDTASPPINPQPGVPGVVPGVEDGGQLDGSNQREGVISNEEGNEGVVPTQGRREESDEGRREEGDEGDEGQVGLPADPSLPPDVTLPGEGQSQPGSEAAGPRRLGQPQEALPVAESIRGSDNEIELWVDGKRQIASVTGEAQEDGTWKVKRVKLRDPETGFYKPYNLTADQGTGYESYEQARDEVFRSLQERFKKPEQIEGDAAKPVALEPPTPETPRRIGQPGRFDQEDMDLADAALDDVLGLPAKSKDPQPAAAIPEGALGVNSSGQAIYEDASGVRSVDRIQEKLGVRPERTPEGGIRYVLERQAREERFKTVEELAAETQPSGNVATPETPPPAAIPSPAPPAPKDSSADAIGHLGNLAAIASVKSLEELDQWIASNSEAVAAGRLDIAIDIQRNKISPPPPSSSRTTLGTAFGGVATDSSTEAASPGQQQGPRRLGQPKEETEARPKPPVSDIVSPDEYTPVPSSVHPDMKGFYDTLPEGDEMKTAFDKPRELRDSKGNPPSTGKPFKANLFTGSGRTDQGSIYAEGADGPALGKGRYTALAADDAKTYGDNVEDIEVRLTNPVVIDSDADLERLGGGRIAYENKDRNNFLRNARQAIEQAGHDGVIVLLPDGDEGPITRKSNKRLREIFGHSQVVEFNPQPATPSTKQPSDRIAEIDRELEKLQADYQKKSASQEKGRGAMVPPPIKGAVLKKISDRMDKLDQEKELIQNAASTKQPDTPRRLGQPKESAEPVSDIVSPGKTNTSGGKPRKTLEERARDELRKQGKRNPSQATVDARARVIAMDDASDAEIGLDVAYSRNQQKEIDRQRAFWSSMKDGTNSATVESLRVGDMSQVNADIAKNRITFERAKSIADQAVAAGILTQYISDRLVDPKATDPPKKRLGQPKADPAVEPPKAQTSKPKPSIVDKPTSDQLLPWYQSTVDDESRWDGTKVKVFPASRSQEEYEGTVTRVLNRGAVVEVQPDGQDGTFRVASTNLSLMQLVDSKATTATTSQGVPEQSALPKGWERSDVEFLRNRIEAGEKIFIFGGDEFGLQSPQQAMSGSDHLGMGYFKKTTPEYDVTWEAGGASLRTPGGKTYTRISEKRGSFPYDKTATLAALDKAIGKGDTPQADPVAESTEKADDIVSPGVPRFDQADMDLADAALNEVLGIKPESKVPSQPKADKTKRLGGKSKSGQITLFPGVEQDIDRQDAVAKARTKFMNGMEEYHGSDGLNDEQATAIKEAFPIIGSILDRVYQDKNIKDESDYEKSAGEGADFESLADLLFMRADVSQSRIRSELEDAVKQVIASRPQAKKIGDKPKTKIQQAAEVQDDKFKAAGNRLLDAIRRNQSKATIGLDAEIMKLSVEFAVEGVKKGAVEFAVFVENAYNTFGESINELIPYMETGWDALHRRNLVQQPAGNAQEIVDRLRNVEQNDGRQVLTGGDTADQEGSGGVAADEKPRRRVDADESLEGVQPGDAQTPEGSRDSDGVRDQDADGVRFGSDGVLEELGDGAIGIATDVPGDVDAGTGGTGRPDGRADVRSDGRGLDQAPKSSRPNFHLTDPDRIIGKGLKDKFARNRQALELSEDLEQSGRPPTQEDLEILASYIGWGAYGQELFQGNWDNPRVKKEWQSENEWLREHLGEDEWRSAQESIPNAHFTDPEVVTGIWDMLRRMGFKGGRFLEPSFGVGNFAALMPRDIMSHTNFTAIELDKATARIAKILYPQINVQQKGYQQSKTPDDFYDASATNVPFGNYQISDKRYRQDYSIHNYFFRKAIDQVKPGGLMAFVTSNMTMDGKEQAKLLRLQLSDRADLVAAYRFPTGAFEKYAKTKVVADLIIIRKRKPGETPSPLNEQWIDIVSVDTPSGQKIDVNKYWTLHPENIMGTLNHGNGTTSGRPGMIVDKPADLAERWQKIIKSVPENILNTERTPNEGKERPNEKKLRQNTVLAKDGELYIAKGEQLLPLKDYVNWYRANSKQATIDNKRKPIESLLKVRNTLEQVLEVQGRGEDASALRKELNRFYDEFVSQYGFISESEAMKSLASSNDAIAAAVKALETKMPDGTYDKRPIFTKSTVRQPPRLGEKLSVTDAFALARNNSVDIDWDNVADVAKTPKADVLEELESKGMIYKIGEDIYDAADVFLSGNMARKVRQIEAAMQEGVPGLERALKAAKQVMPESLIYSQIQVGLGAPWIPAEDYSQFVADLLQETPEKTVMSRGTRGWRADFAAGVNNAPSVVTHGHPDVPFSRLVTAAFNNGRVRVFYRDSNNNQVFDEQATIDANAKIDELKEKFADWIWMTPDRIDRLAKAYNEDFRSTVTPDYRNIEVPLLFEGLALQKGDTPFDLRKHQIAAIWRAIVSGKGLFAHEVGTGKTLTMAGIAMESRRLRLANKPLLLAHNANSIDVYREIQAAYPGAKILYVDNLDPKRKAETMASIATEDWDLVIVPHSLTKKFSMRPETLERLLKEQMDELEAAALEAYAEDESNFKGEMPTDLDNISKEDMRRLRSRTAKELVKERLKLREKIVKAYNDADSESTIFIEDMGIDMVMVDEAHIFKKLPIASRQQVKGLNKKASQAGSMLMLLADYVRSTQNGRGVYLFTGTPVTNTLNEIYNMQRFIMPDEMQAVGVKDWDGWFNTFATSELADELSAGGTYEAFERLTSFVNLPELREMIGQYMDTVFADEMVEFVPRETRNGRVEEGDEIIGRPYKQIHNETLPMSDLQKRTSQDLATRYRRVRDAKGREKMELLRTHDYMPLVISGQGVSMALDPRMIDGVAPATIDPKDQRLKINRMISNAMDHYYEHPKSTQMIFMQIGHSDWTDRVVGRDNDGNPITQRVRVYNLSKEIKRRLIEEGVPESEIVMFSDLKKEKRADAAMAMNRGEVRFAIGSTETMGTGINAQENLRAMHHLDAPWMPGDLEQRNGRGQRQGNRWNTVHEYRYLTESPQDGRRWQVLLTKDRFIKRFMRSKGDERVIDMSDVDLDDAGGGDMEATFSAAVGDPRIQQRFRLTREVEKLETAKERHRQTINNVQSEARHQLAALPLKKDELADLEADYKLYQDSRPDPGVEPTMIILAEKVKNAEYTADTTIVGRDAIDEAIEPLRQRYRYSHYGKERKIAKYRGFDVWISEAGNLHVGKRQIHVKESSLASLDGTLRNLVKRIEGMQARIDKVNAFVKSADGAARLPFVRQPQLDAKRKKLAALIAEMEANPEGSPSWFRNAAPIGSAIFLKKRKRADGRQAFADMEDEDQRESMTREPSPQNVREEMEEHAVTGYRSDTHVFYEIRDETIAVPADEVFNENGDLAFQQIDEVREAYDAGELPPNTSGFVTKLGSAARDKIKRRFGRNTPGQQPPAQPPSKPGDTMSPATLPPGPTSDERGEPLRQADVVTTWKRLFGVPIKQGGFRWRTKRSVTDGIHNWLTDVIRLREGMAYDLIVAAHEIGHHIDKMLNLYGRNSKDSRLLQLFAADKKRYYKVFGQLQALDYDNSQKRVSEGIAEAVRYIITGTSEQDAKVAPDAVAWVREQLDSDPVFRNATEQAIEHAKKYVAQGSLQRARSVFGGPPVDLDKRELLKQQILSAVDQQYVNFVDRLYVVKKFSDDIASKGKIAKGEATLYETATAFDGTIAARVARSVTDGIYSVMTNQRMGPSLQEATEHLTDNADLKDAMTYAVAVHGLEQPVGYEFNMHRDDAKDFIDWVRSDQDKANRYDKFHKTLTEYNNALMMMVAETGRITPEEFARMLDAHGETYVPLLREMDDQRIKRKLGRSSENLVELPKAFQRRTAQGSGRPIKNLIESSIERAMHLTSQALRQELHNKMVAQADPQSIDPDGRTGAENLGRWMDRIPPGSTQHATEVAEILGQLVERGFFSPGQADAMRRAQELRMGVSPSDAAVVRLRKYYGLSDTMSLGEALTAVESSLQGEPDISDVVSFYTPDYKRPNGKYVIKVMRGGKPQLYEVDAQLYEAMLMQPDEARDWFFRSIDYFNRQFKVGAVGLNTAFLVGNLMADAQTFAVNSKYTEGTDRATKALEWTAAYIGAVTMGKPNEIVDLFREQGGELYNMIGVDSRRLPNTIRRMLSDGKWASVKKAEGRDKVLEGMRAITQSVEEVADHARAFNAMSDAGPRLAEMEGVFKDHGYVFKDGKLFNTANDKFETPSRDIVIKAMFAAGDVTYNYRRGGKWKKQMERGLPFSNAAIQSVDKTIRTYREAIKGLGSSDADQRKWAKSTVIAFAGLSAIAFVAKYARLDDEEEQDEWLRAGYAQIGLPGGGVVRARLSREHGWLTNMLIAGLRQVSGDGDAMRRSLIHEATSRIPLPSGAGPVGVVAEQFMNYQISFDKNIETDYIEGIQRDSLSPAYRYDERTLWSSKAVGGALGVSPMRLEHAASGLSGGRYTRWMGSIERLAVGELSAKDIPFVRGLYFDDTRMSVSKSRFYDEMARADREVNDQLRVKGGKYDEGMLSALTKRQSMLEASQAMKLLRDFRSDEYESQDNEVAIARSQIGMAEHPNYPDPYRTEVPPEVEAALRKKAVNDLGEISRGLGRPREKKGQEPDDYQQELGVWEAKRAGTMQFYAERMDAPLVEAAVKEVRNTPAFRDLLMGKGAPRRPESGKIADQREYREETKRFGQRRQEALEFQRLGR